MQACKPFSKSVEDIILYALAASQCHALFQVELIVYNPHTEVTVVSLLVYLRFSWKNDTMRKLSDGHTYPNALSRQVGRSTHEHRPFLDSACWIRAVAARRPKRYTQTL
jgi:hypothetical protein